MNAVRLLFSLVGPSSVPPELGHAQRRVLAAVAVLAGLPLAAVWGVAAGSAPGVLAVGNVLSVPMLLVSAGLVALPIGLLGFRLVSENARATELLLAHSSGLFVGGLVLALFAPLVALYQFSSAWMGPAIAMGTAVFAALAGLAIVFRVLGKLMPDAASARALAAPMLLVIALEAVALAQVASVTDPIFAERTALGRGVDVLHGQHEVR